MAEYRVADVPFGADASRHAPETPPAVPSTSTSVGARQKKENPVHCPDNWTR